MNRDNGEPTPPSSERDSLPAGFDPREVLRVLSGQRWLLLTVTAAVVIGTALYSFTATPYYRASVRILIERDSERVMSFKEIYNLGAGADDYYVTQYKILESRAVAEAALKLLPAGDRKWFEKAKDPVLQLLQLRRIRPVQKSRLVDIQAEHPDPKAAARIANAIVQAYIDNVDARRSSASSSALVDLREEAKDLQAKLRAAEEESQAFKVKNKIVSMGDQQSLVSARLEKLSEELSEVERKRRDAEARLAVAKRAAPAKVASDAIFRLDLPEVLQSRVIADHKSQLLLAQQQRSSLVQKYRPKHPRMIEVNQRIAAIEAQLHGEVAAIERGIEQEYQQLEQHEKDVRKRLEEQSDALLELERKSIEYQIMRDGAANIRRLHDAVLGRLKEVEMMSEQEANNVHRIGDAEVTNKPVRPRKLLNLALAVLLGLVLSCGLAFGIDALDRSIKTPADATRLLGQQVLGLVPRLEGKRELRGKVDPETFDNRSSLSEAFRTIRTNFAFSEAGRDVRSVVVTSATAEEGKSMVSINFAVSMARSGKRVLLIDADMRRPRQHRAFEIEAEEGLSSALIGARDGLELVHQTPEENLFLLPCGLIPPNPVELLESEGLTRFIEQMLEHFDLVVFDSPPAGIVSDACVIGTRVDRAIFVVRSFKTDRVLARRSLQRMLGVGARMAGIILNHSDSRADRYGRYEYEYSYLSSYEYAEASEARAEEEEEHALGC